MDNTDYENDCGMDCIDVYSEFGDYISEAESSTEKPKIEYQGTPFAGGTMTVTSYSKMHREKVEVEKKHKF